MKICPVNTKYAFWLRMQLTVIIGVLILYFLQNAMVYHQPRNETNKKRLLPFQQPQDHATTQFCLLNKPD
jgi:hypothetical protein